MSKLHTLLLAAPLAIYASVAAAEEKTYSIDIPAQSLVTALDTLAQQTGIKPFYTDSIVTGKKSPAVSGHLSPRLALEQLLSGSGLAYKFNDNQAVAITQRVEPQSATTLPPVNVTGKATYNATDPYNPDYVLPSATSGTKTDTPIMETPLNVQVISKQVLKDQQVITLGDALKNVSGVTVLGGSTAAGSTGNPVQSIVLRGFQSETFFRDGFRLQQGSASREMANVESVEVLKGPAAILYGLVEPGGMVNVVTKQPLAKPYYALNQQFGSYDLYRTTIDATGPLTKDDTLLYRINMSYQNSGSFRDLVDKEDVFLAPVLKWNISPRTQATFELEYNHQHIGSESGFVPLFNGKLLNIPISRNYGEYSPVTSETIYGGFNWSHQFNDDWSVKHRFSVNQQNNSANNFVSPLMADSVSVSRYLSAEENQYNTYSTNLDLTGHFNTAGLQHTLLLGGDYYRLNTTAAGKTAFDTSVFDFSYSQIDLLNPVHPGTPFSSPLVPWSGSKLQTDQFGLYIQDQIKLPYDIHVMGGIRYQNIHQIQQNIYGDLLSSFGFQNTSQATSQDAVTPRVGILWQAQNWLSLYANYVESFGANTGQVFVSPAQSKPVPPTSSEQYEGGIKTEFFNGRLRANWAYFDLTKTNVATADKDPYHQSFGNYSIVAGAVRSRGTEFDVTGEILPGWNLIATYSYTDARVIKSNEAGFSTGNGSFGPEGMRLWGVPRNTGSLWNTYELQNGELKGLKLGGGVTLRDGQTGCCDDPAHTIPGYATVDLLAAYSRKVGKSKVTVQLNVNNLLDKNYYTGLYTQAGSNGAYVDFGAPRTFMGSIGIQF